MRIGPIYYFPKTFLVYNCGNKLFSEKRAFGREAIRAIHVDLAFPDVTKGGICATRELGIKPPYNKCPLPKF